MDQISGTKFRSTCSFIQVSHSGFNHHDTSLRARENPSKVADYVAVIRCRLLPPTIRGLNIQQLAPTLASITGCIFCTFPIFRGKDFLICICPFAILQVLVNKNIQSFLIQDSRRSFRILLYSLDVTIADIRCNDSVIAFFCRKLSFWLRLSWTLILLIDFFGIISMKLLIQMFMFHKFQTPPSHYNPKLLKASVYNLDLSV